MHAPTLFAATSSSDWIILCFNLALLLLAWRLSVLSEFTCLSLIISLVLSQLFCGEFSLFSDVTLINLMMTHSFSVAALCLLLLYAVDVVFEKEAVGPALILDYVANVAVLFGQAGLIVAMIAYYVGKEAAQELRINLGS